MTKAQEYRQNLLAKNPNYFKDYYIKNKDVMKCKMNLWRQENQERERARKRKWKKENRDYIRTYDRNYKRRYKSERRKRDPIYKIIENLRTALNRVLNGEIKSNSTLRLLGCTKEQLFHYLESQFVSEMTWENYGGNDYSKKHWHIDHIKPCSSFDMSSPEEQRKCFHYTNLQPLWAEDNLKKGNKFNLTNTEICV